MGRLSGTVAVVTGGGTGIGRHIAIGLAGACARVAVVGRRQGVLQETVDQIVGSGGEAIGVSADLVDKDATDAAFAEITDRLGPVDTLINNAGAFSAYGPLWEVDPEVWWADVETNVKSTFLCSRAVLPGMVEREQGHVVNMIGGGTAAPLPMGSGYSVSKTGIMRLTECMAATLTDTGVICLAMAPGLVRTEMTDRQLSSEAGQKYLPGMAKRFEAGDFLPPSRAADLAVAIAKGRFDQLAGRAVSATEPLDKIEASIPNVLCRDRRRLALPGYGPTMKPTDA